MNELLAEIVLLELDKLLGQLDKEFNVNTGLFKVELLNDKEYLFDAAHIRVNVLFLDAVRLGRVCRLLVRVFAQIIKVEFKLQLEEFSYGLDQTKVYVLIINPQAVAEEVDHAARKLQGTRSACLDDLKISRTKVSLQLMSLSKIGDKLVDLDKPILLVISIGSGT